MTLLRMGSTGLEKILDDEIFYSDEESSDSEVYKVDTQILNIYRKIDGYIDDYIDKCIQIYEYNVQLYIYIVDLYV